MIMSSSYPILYSFRRCPYAIRARLAIDLANFKCELREVNLSRKPKEMLNISPKGTVPVLELNNGIIVDESVQIMKHVLGKNFLESVISTFENNNAEKDFLKTFDMEFKYHLDRYKYSSRYADVDRLEHRQEALLILRDFDLYLGNRKFGENFSKNSFVDIAVAPFVRQFRMADISWFDSSNGLTYLKFWLNNFLTSNLLAEVMVKNPVWFSGAPRIVFPNSHKLR